MSQEKPQRLLDGQVKSWRDGPLSLGNVILLVGLVSALVLGWMRLDAHIEQAVAVAVERSSKAHARADVDAAHPGLARRYVALGSYNDQMVKISRTLQLIVANQQLLMRKAGIAPLKVNP
ncbi:MAG: hypothetical protein ACTSX8_09080 [Alphaproteobacteria bacterium]